MKNDNTNNYWIITYLHNRNYKGMLDTFLQPDYTFGDYISTAQRFPTEAVAQFTIRLYQLGNNVIAEDISDIIHTNGGDINEQTG